MYMAAWAFCATEHFPLPLFSRSAISSSASVVLSNVRAACRSSLGCLTQPELLRGGDRVYSSLKSEPIMSTDVTGREEGKRERRKYQRAAKGEKKATQKNKRRRVLTKETNTEEHFVL